MKTKRPQSCLQIINRYSPRELKFLAILLIAFCVSADQPQACGQTNPQSGSQESKRYLSSTDDDSAKQRNSALKKVTRTDAQWRKQLSADEYRVTRKKGTELAYSGKYWNNKKDGVYLCKCCQHPLFDSKQKYDSKTGWPSYTAPMNKRSVDYAPDTFNNMVRTEVLCRRCDAHLGHVFSDGPRPTGLRYCMNSVALKFVTRKQWKQQSKKTAKTKTETEVNEAKLDLDSAALSKEKESTGSKAPNSKPAKKGKQGKQRDLH